jgi:hypothetical protein
LTANASCVLSLIQALQCSFDLDDGLQIALEFTHSDFAIGASRRYAGIVVRVGVHRQFVARPVYALLVNLQLCEQAFAKHFEVTLAFTLMGMRFGFHGSRFPSVGGRLYGASAGNEMKNQRKYGENEQQVNQSAGDVKHQESASPRKKKHNCDHKKRSDIHFASPMAPTDCGGQ